MQRAKAAALGATLLVYALSWRHPRWPQEQALHDSGAVIGIAWLLVHDRRWRMGAVMATLGVLLAVASSMLFAPRAATRG